jgi:hypothetical protein
MHACGHDGHTAMAVAAARVLARQRDRLPGNVIFAFQPAEETTGGADQMIPPGGRIKYTQAPVSLENLIGQMIFSQPGGQKKPGEGETPQASPK